MQTKWLGEEDEDDEEGFEVLVEFVKMFKCLGGMCDIYGEDLERFSKVMMVMGVRRKSYRGTVTVERTDAVSKSNRYVVGDVRLLRKR